MIGYVAINVNDGHIPSSALRVIGYSNEPEVIQELVSKGLWKAVEGGFQCAGDWETDFGQSTAAYVTERREKARLRQAKRRSSSLVTRDVPRDVGEERLGKERKERQGGTDWPEVRQPGNGAHVYEDEVF
ncbi:hypothetical protein N8716_00650 [Pontimonas sp.]|nr:hypothetical protein [Pontimonas sp.]